MNLHEIEEAIRELEQGSCTYGNCAKLASLYIIREEMRKSGQGMYTYARGGNYARGGGGGNYARGGSGNYARGGNYGYYPMMYERGGNSGNSSSSYEYRRPMYYDDEDLMIRKQDMFESQGR